MKVLLAKIGLDGHDVGIRLIARRCVEEGAEMIYLGKRNTPEAVVAAAVQEDVDAVGVSSLTGGLATLTLEILAGLRTEGYNEIRVVAGGIVESEEAQALERAGVPLFRPGDPVESTVAALLGGRR